MRILYVVHQFVPGFHGGTEQVCQNVARAAQRSGHYVHVLACTMHVDMLQQMRNATQPSWGIRTICQGVPVTGIPRSGTSLSLESNVDSDLDVASEVARWIASEQFGIAHLMHPMWTDSALLAVKRSGIPYVVTLTDVFSGLGGSPDSAAPPWTEEELTGGFEQDESILENAAARTCPSEFVAARYRTDFPNLSFSVIPHGIDMLALLANNCDVTRRDSELRLGYVDGLVPQKGVDVLLHAFVRVQNTNLRLTMCCGNGSDATFADDVKRLADSDCRVELLRPVSLAETFRTIQSLDVLCVPSRVPEAFSFVLHEAAAVGVPAIVSALGAPGEMVTAYGSGMVLPPGDVDAWTAAIAMLSEQPSLIKAWAALVPLPRRIEEEAFFYESLYRQFHRV